MLTFKNKKIATPIISSLLQNIDNNEKLRLQGEKKKKCGSKTEEKKKEPVTGKKNLSFGMPPAKETKIPVDASQHYEGLWEVTSA